MNIVLTVNEAICLADLHPKAGRRAFPLDRIDTRIDSVFAGPSPNGIALEAIYQGNSYAASLIFVCCGGPQKRYRLSVAPVI